MPTDERNDESNACEEAVRRNSQLKLLVQHKRREPDESDVIKILLLIVVFPENYEEQKMLSIAKEFLPGLHEDASSADEAVSCAAIRCIYRRFANPLFTRVVQVAQTLNASDLQSVRAYLRLFDAKGDLCLDDTFVRAYSNALKDLQRQDSNRLFGVGYFDHAEIANTLKPSNLSRAQLEREKTLSSKTVLPHIEYNLLGFRGGTELECKNWVLMVLFDLCRRGFTKLTKLKPRFSVPACQFFKNPDTFAAAIAAKKGRLDVKFPRFEAMSGVSYWVTPGANFDVPNDAETNHVVGLYDFSWVEADVGTEEEPEVKRVRYGCQLRTAEKAMEVAAPFTVAVEDVTDRCRVSKTSTEKLQGPPTDYIKPFDVQVIGGWEGHPFPGSEEEFKHIGPVADDTLRAAFTGRRLTPCENGPSTVIKEGEAFKRIDEIVIPLFEGGPSSQRRGDLVEKILAQCKKHKLKVTLPNGKVHDQDAMIKFRDLVDALTAFPDVCEGGEVSELFMLQILLHRCLELPNRSASWLKITQPKP